MSDLHMEGTVYLPPEMPDDAETCLVLAGDINVGCNAIYFLREMASRFKYVIYIFGNHEFYHHSIPAVRAGFKEIMGDYPIHNLFILDNTAVELDGIRFIGSTLWTDLRHDKLLMRMAGSYMNDFSVIFQGVDKTKLFTPMQSVQQHDMAVHFIEAELKKPFEGETIVVTHHMPSYTCVAPRWLGNTMNPAFCSNLDWIMEKYAPAYWIHGHTHDTIHEVVDQTIIRCNPKGYGRENQRNFNPEAIFEI